MVSCWRCKRIRDVSGNLATAYCPVCGKSYHSRCLVRLIQDKPLLCCSRQAGVPADGSCSARTEARRADTACAVGAGRAESRFLALDALRGVGNESDSPDNCEEDEPSSMASAAELKAYHDDLKHVIKERFDTVEALIAATNKKIDEHQSALATVSSEISYIKTIVTAARPSTELRIQGVPRSALQSTPEALREFFGSTMDLLGIPQVLDGVLEFRVFGDDPRPRDASNDAHTPTFSFVANFKQPASRAYVMRHKRRHGKVKHSDVTPGGSDAEIRFYELLPGPVYKLFQDAKARGREHKYAAVWCDDGRLFARKAANAQRIEIITEADLANIA
ncbi:unnamed protein product [Trichogramma brassicae]|uniref:FP protein C-terminal domain-containing protein n=1 Tax=Trichogramma brassicae TaxID=86971 RepID=A0A6H5IQJ9_9HYME|nr:unnamed protein product [Trichogramma brassicae]